MPRFSRIIKIFDWMLSEVGREVDPDIRIYIQISRHSGDVNMNFTPIVCVQLQELLEEEALWDIDILFR